MSDAKVTFSKDGAVGQIILNDGKVNSYDIQFMKDLDAAIDACIADDEVRVGVMSSQSPKGLFSAGADIKAFIANSVDDNLGMIEFAHAALRKMGTSPKLFVAAINGGAFGGGLEMALACDFRFAAEGEYKMGLPEVTLGLLPGNGGTVRLPRLIGQQKALELMVTGKVVGPDEAHALGIVDKLYPGELLMDKTLGWASRMAGQATLAIGRIKQSVMEGMDMSLDDALAHERKLIVDLFNSDDATEGLTAFAEKRKAAFKGS